MKIGDEFREEKEVLESAEGIENKSEEPKRLHGWLCNKARLRMIPIVKKLNT